MLPALLAGGAAGWLLRGLLKGGKGRRDEKGAGRGEPSGEVRKLRAELERCRSRVAELEAAGRSSARAPKRAAAGKTATDEKPTGKKPADEKPTGKKPASGRKPAPAAKDDLTKIEGVGPKIASLLDAAGITSWSRLAESSKAELEAVLEKAGRRYAMHDPSTWPQQAALAAAGDWEGLEKLQGELKGGRRG